MEYFEIGRLVNALDDQLTEEVCWELLGTEDGFNNSAKDRLIRSIVKQIKDAS